MGLLDSFMKALNDGDIDKKIVKAIDKVETSLDKTIKQSENVVNKADTVIKKAQGGESQLPRP